MLSVSLRAVPFPDKIRNLRIFPEAYALLCFLLLLEILCFALCFY